MNEFQANLCTFFIKDKEKREFVKKLVMDKSFYNKINPDIKKVTNIQANKPNSRYDLFKIREREIGNKAAIDEMLTSYIEPVQEAVQKELQNIKEEPKSANYPMFTMWLQDNPPELIKMCFDSIKRFYPELIIITEKNMVDYLDVPDYMLKKFNNGIIPATQFSDYIRAALLDKYGGIWIDATYYMLAPIPRYISKAKSFAFKSHETDMISSNFLQFEKNNYLIKTMRVFMEQYWKQEDFLIHYFFFHIYFMLAVKNDPQCAAIWKSIPFALNTNPQFLLHFLSHNFDEDILKYVRQTSFMYKLTYKDKNAENNPNSWFWYLINQWRQGILLTSALEHEL